MASGSRENPADLGPSSSWAAVPCASSGDRETGHWLWAARARKPGEQPVSCVPGQRGTCHLLTNTRSKTWGVAMHSGSKNCWNSHKNCFVPPYSSPLMSISFIVQNSHQDHSKKKFLSNLQPDIQNHAHVKVSILIAFTQYAIIYKTSET